MTRQPPYRLYGDSDLPGLLRLWETDTKWGGIGPESWRRRYVDGPHGPSLVSVAVDEDRGIVGHLVFAPSRVSHRARTLVRHPCRSRSVSRTR